MNARVHHNNFVMKIGWLESNEGNKQAQKDKIEEGWLSIHLRLRGILRETKG